MPHASKQHGRQNRVWYYLCTGAAIAVVAGIWVWNVRSVVSSGVAGAKDVLSTVATTASDVKQQSQPDQASIDAVKQGFQQVIKSAADQETQKDQTVDAVAQLMSDKLAASADAAAPSSQQ